MKRVIKKRMVIDFVQMNGQTNLREAASVAGVSKTTAHRFLKEEGFLKDFLLNCKDLDLLTLYKNIPDSWNS